MDFGRTVPKVATLRSFGAPIAPFLVILSFPLVVAAAAAQQAGASPERELLDQYCVSCHSDTRRIAGLALDTMDLANVGDGAEIWEKVVTKLRAGMMPPAGRPRPDQASYVSLTSYLETELDRAAASNPDPGRSDALRRLNATEYRNAIRDLLHLEVDVTTLLPADDSSAGFDNVSLGGLDPGRLERYLTAARKISRLAVGAEVRSAVADTFIVPSDLNQTGHIEGLPFGTRGGTTVRYNFPVDAEYELRVELGKSWNSNSVGGLREPQDVVITVDGEPVTVMTVTRPRRPRRPPAQQQQEPQEPQQNQSQRQGQQQGQPQAQQQAVGQGLYQPGGKAADADLFVRVPVMAGPRTVGAAFVSQGFQMLERHRQPFQKIHITVGGDQRAEPNVYSITITGPFDATGPGDTPSRRRIFSCRPTDASRAAEAGCAEEILATLARRAYRRPVTDADVALLLGFYREGREVGDFEAGIEMALRRLLVSPEFLFRVERDPLDQDEADASRPYLISDLELASRLSFFLWANIPDDELIDVAASGTLRNPAVLESQVRRMLADPRADTLVTNFAAQWLYLRNLPAVSPNYIAFPDFDDTLRRAMRQETELFFGSIIHEDRSALDLLTADYTFVNERLAKHYDIPNIYGSHFRRITLPPDSPRGGLLGQGSILAVTAYATRTSPVVRGKWILENLLGPPPPPPPPNVPPLSEDKSDAVLSMRERMVEHRRNPVCASCHAIMDPVGLSLENFDAVGRWRTLTDGFAPIDASGSFPDGTTFDGVAGLKQAILGRSDQFVRTLTGKLLTYALGRAMEYYDAPAIRAIERTAARDDYRFSSLILGIVQSTPFQMRRPPDSLTTVASR